MIDLGVLPYLWIKAIHIVFVITWMAGLLYLPRLFVYHSVATPQSEKSETFKVMERRLVRGIMVPSLFIVIASGGFLLASSSKEVWLEGWVICKILLVGLLVS